VNDGAFSLFDGDRDSLALKPLSQLGHPFVNDVRFLFQHPVFPFPVSNLQMNRVFFVRPVQTNPCRHFLLFHSGSISFLSDTRPLGFDPAQAL
jgi:hypothetical protein